MAVTAIETRSLAPFETRPYRVGRAETLAPRPQRAEGFPLDITEGLTAR
jgi:hypothetical protein